MCAQESFPAHLLRGRDWKNLSVEDLKRQKSCSQNENFKKNVPVSSGLPASPSGSPASLLAVTPYSTEFSAAKRAVMNKTEAMYATAYLEAERLQGKILAWKFESMRLVMAAKTCYIPDFMVILPDRTIRFDEVKGFWRDDARVKIKMAAELFPYFFFRAIQWDSKEKFWKIENFS